MFTRQKVLLGIVENAGGRITRLHLVKYAFLLAQSISVKSRFYQFVPYRYGPFSFNLYHELDQLINLGYLICDPTDDKTLRLSNQCSFRTLGLDLNLNHEISRLFAKYGKYPLPDLINIVYDKYPWFTLNSDQPAFRKASFPEANQAIYTVGYEGWQVDGFLNYLLTKGIRRLIDTRNNPVSRSYGFHKSTLSRLCLGVGIEYSHKPNLGIPPTLRADLRSYTDYLILFANYEQQIPESEIQIVLDLLNDMPSVLMCVEADPKLCHRGRLASKIEKSSNLSVVNL